MIIIKNKNSIRKMEVAGELLATVFAELNDLMIIGNSTLYINNWIEKQLSIKGLLSCMKGYMGYRYVSCISVNDEVVHGVPSDRVLCNGDFVSVDVCASYRGYCADMARMFFIGTVSDEVRRLANVAEQALFAGISKTVAGNRLGDVSFAIQQVVEAAGFGIVREFAGHGIGKNMHEDPELLNYGVAGQGVLLRQGMALAIEPMITAGDYAVYVKNDNWTVCTADKSLAAHVEDTIVITDNGPKNITRHIV